MSTVKRTATQVRTFQLHGIELMTFGEHRYIDKMSCCGCACECAPGTTDGTSGANTGSNTDQEFLSSGSTS